MVASLQPDNNVEPTV